MLHDSVAIKYWEALYEKFPEYQFILIEKESKKLVASANCLPLLWEKELNHLPAEGWDWAMTHGFSNLSKKVNPNFLCALSISVAPDFQGKGISNHLVKIMQTIAKNKKFVNLIAPVRPNYKCKYPLTPIENYIHWKNGDGFSFDPWIRVHEQLGGKIVKVCNKSMKITGSVGDWQRWTDMIFPETMEYVVPGALTPISICLESDVGTYIEPNVWIVHSTK